MEIHPYQLFPQASGALNARVDAAAAAKGIAGCLIRVDGGVGCLHPWPQLGDAPLEVHVQSLRTGTPTVMARQALACCARDAAARRAGVSLFCGLPASTSHWTLTAIPSPDELDSAVAAGFTHAKLKFPASAQARQETLLFLQNQAAASSLKWRLDANSALDLAAAKETLQELAKLPNIDFIEDPTPYDAETWKWLSDRYGVTLAADWVSGPVPSAAAAVRVVKPGHGPLPSIAPGQRVVFTSLMDHPVGQAWAALNAAEAQNRGNSAERHGLLTHWLFAATDFSDELPTFQPTFQPPLGTGLGFDLLLDRLEWHRL